MEVRGNLATVPRSVQPTRHRLRVWHAFKGIFHSSLKFLLPYLIIPHAFYFVFSDKHTLPWFLAAPRRVSNSFVWVTESDRAILPSCPLYACCFWFANSSELLRAGRAFHVEGRGTVSEGNQPLCHALPCPWHGLFDGFRG